MRARPAAGELDQRRCDVEREHHLAHPCPGGDAPGEAHEECGAAALLVREAPLRAQAVLAEEKAVVAKEHDAGLLELSSLMEDIQDPADALVHRSHHRRALADFLLR